MKKSKANERLWWMVLVEAECQIGYCSAPERVQELLLWVQVANRARLALRDLHKINLDKYGEQAKDLMDDLFQEEKEKHQKTMDMYSSVEYLLNQVEGRLEELKSK
jgi:hypothetical protein